MASILLVASDCPSLESILDQIRRDIRLLGQYNDRLGRKRPDGVGVNWRQKRVCIVENTRAYDEDRNALKIADDFKTTKYGPLLAAILGKLGDGWSGSILPFTTGIRGSVDVRAWDLRLKLLGLDSSARAATIKDAVAAALAALDVLYTARFAAGRCQ
jgi:hypothetical protein